MNQKKALNQKLLDVASYPQFSRVISEVLTYDGLKIVFEDDSWISARFSGTEPLLRVFDESQDGAFANDMITLVESHLELF